MPHMQATIKVPIAEITWQAVLCMVDVFDSEIEVCQHRTGPITTGGNTVPEQSEVLATRAPEGDENNSTAPETPIQDGIGLNSMLEDMRQQLTSLVEAVSQGHGGNESNRAILNGINELKQLISQAQDTTKNHLAEFKDWMVRTYDDRIQVLSRHLEAEIYCKKRLQDQLNERNVIIERVKKELLANGGLDQVQIDELKRQSANGANTDLLVAELATENQPNTQTPNSHARTDTAPAVPAAPRKPESGAWLQVAEDGLDMSTAVPPPSGRMLRNSLLSIIRCPEVQPLSEGTTFPPGLTRSPDAVRQVAVPLEPPVLLLDGLEETNAEAIAAGHKFNVTGRKGQERGKKLMGLASPDTTATNFTGLEGSGELSDDGVSSSAGQESSQSSGHAMAQKSTAGAHGVDTSGGAQPVNPQEQTRNKLSGAFKAEEIAPMPILQCDTRDVEHGNIGLESSE